MGILGGGGECVYYWCVHKTQVHGTPELCLEQWKLTRGEKISFIYEDSVAFLHEFALYYKI